MSVMGCAEVERFLDAYLDGEFAPEDRVELEQHLAGCPACARQVRFHGAFKSRLRATAGRPPLPAGLRDRMTAALDPQQRFSPVAADAISWNRRALPVEVTGGDDKVRAWFHDKVDFAVHPPRLPNAALVGARLANIRDRQAAYLVYDVRGAKVSVFVFDPGGMPLEARSRREIGNHEIYLDGERGYHVALYRDRGVGYAIASDLDEDQMIGLVSSAVQP
jgi:anti-sigma factor (TIGR02949 family)